MTTPEWSLALAILEAACELPPAGRRAWVEACDAPEHVRLQVLRMLEGEELDPVGPEAGQHYGRYELLEPLGQGGMGVVWSARDSELGRLVAMKFVAARAGAVQGMERLVYEAQAASALNHPNLVTVHEILKTEAGVALVAELIEGESLRVWCGRPQETRQIAGWGAQIARGLAAAHARGILHGDIKPENVMVRPDGYVKVLDFGLARKEGLDTTDWDALGLGSLGYMSPEQTTGQRLTPASDVFSLGVVLLELAAGKHPFLESSVSETTRAINEREVLLPESSRVAGRGLRRLLKAMLEKDPARRPSAAEAAARLEVLAAGRTGWKRGRIVWAAVAGVVLAGIGWYWNRERPQPPLPAPVSVTSYTGVESQPALSPDGARVAFVWTGLDDAEQAIYVKSVEGEDTRKLTSDPREHSTPAWSPDGRWIAYVRRASSGGDADVLMRPAGGGEERLVGHVVDHQGYRGLAWWPDSQSLVTRDAGPEGRPLVRLFLTGQKQILTAARDAQDSRPAISPDGRTLAFVRALGGVASLCRMPLQGGRESCQPADHSINSLAWYADSRSLLLSDSRGLFRLAPDERLQPLFEGPVNELAVSGTRAVFGRSLRDLNVWRLDTSTGAATKLIASSEEDSEPEFSPDGHSILFRSNRTGFHELFLCDRNGRHPRQLTHLKAHSGSARWSPDGRWIAFDSDHRAEGHPGNRPQFNNIYVVPAAGGTPRRLTDNTVERLVPGWSSDSRWIYFTQEPGSRRETWKIPVEGGDAVLVAGEEMFEPVEGDEGRSIYFTRPRDRAPGIWRRAVAGGPAVRVAGTQNLVYRWWALQGGGLFFLRSDPEPGFVRLQLNGGSPRKLAAPPKSIFNGPRNMAVSPDSGTILYTHLDLTLGDLFRLDLNP